uniref:ORF118 protein n=1 Tax=Plutella xylostella granulovirus TaxID=98383 RepID=A0A1B2CSM2_9BBAC|nr:PlxyGVORF119 protein [Plutella xylostella granulovirus]QKV50043.1 ORF118 protein [Plutella xylostella granulovirus]QKV50161.1 ORF118 protein [Plutella xylostella granulovirus]
MCDRRVMFMSRETREVLNFTIDLATNMIKGSVTVLNCNFTCFKCFRHFNSIVEKTGIRYIFIVIKDWLKVEEDYVKFCCLECKTGLKLMDLVEIYPTVTLINVKKLMYNNVFKKFVFNFNDLGKKKYKRYSVNRDLGEALKDIVRDKDDDSEIENITLVDSNGVVAHDRLMDMRVDFSKDDKIYYNFDTFVSLNKRLISMVNAEIQKGKKDYVLEVNYRLFEEYQPFLVCFNKQNLFECKACKGKLHDNVPVLFCNKCGVTDPNYWSRSKKHMTPFWRGSYNYKKSYWKTVDKKHNVNLMLYNENVLL